MGAVPMSRSKSRAAVQCRSFAAASVRRNGSAERRFANSTGSFSEYFMSAVLLAIACALEELSVMIIILPIPFPLVVAFGFDAVWFGIIMIVRLEIGFTTPPVAAEPVRHTGDDARRIGTRRCGQGPTSSRSRTPLRSAHQLSTQSGGGHGTVHSPLDHSNVHRPVRSRREPARHQRGPQRGLPEA
jgi:hypothetical protein